jgi:hypothetical protein
LNAEHDWPFEKATEGGVRPWFLSATGYLVVLFADLAGAQRAREVLSNLVPDGDMRLYDAEETLAIEARRSEASSKVAKAVVDMTVDESMRETYLETTRAGGAALWVYAPDDDVADRVIRLLANHEYVHVRYYGRRGIQDLPGEVRS